MAVEAENILHDLIGRVARVRRWLVALGVLKTAAIGLTGVCLYVCLYAWIDHHAHFGHAARLLALLVLIGLLAVLSYSLFRSLKRRMTYAYAANYVENRRSFDQQLVAAVEYFERGQDYPYSRALAEQLVLQVDEAARGFRFDSTVAKWHGYVLASLVALALFVVGLFVQQNVLYFSSYLSRLLRPLAKIEPVPATVLESVTEDLVVARDSPVTLTVAIQGRAPESASLVLTRHDPNDANTVSERLEVSPAVDAQGNAAFTATRTFSTPGHFSYQFEAGAASSEAHTVKVCDPPLIKSMTATVSVPQSKGQGAATYTQQVNDGMLEVLPGSTIDLQVECTSPLREASMTAPGGQPVGQTPDGANSFGVRFPADRAGAVEFKLTSADGIANREPQQLRLVLKGDEPPGFKLLCPDGDCLATDVASIPITFEVTDDFGLEAVQFYCELPRRDPALLESRAAGGAKSMILTHTLELERCDVQVGDSILFYARATDISTGQRAGDANSSSEVYFIEIRPYRQYWHPEEGGQPSSTPGRVPEDLITILEYTRALLKKTWALANASLPAGESASRLKALRGDVEYCTEALASTRDDPDNGFSESDKAALRKIGQCYEDAGDKLRRGDADAALPAVRDAYRLLRQFIDELHLKWTPPQSGQSVPEEKPERVKLQEQPQNSELDKQRSENQLEKLQRKLDSLAREQKSLGSDLNKALQQEQAGSTGQPDGASSSSAGSTEQTSPGAANAPRQQSAKDARSADHKAASQTPGDKQIAGDTSLSKGQQGDKRADSPKQDQAAQDPSNSTQTQSQSANQSSGQQGSSPGSSGTPQKSPASQAGSAQATLQGGKQDDSTRLDQAAQGQANSTQTQSQNGNQSGKQQSSSPGNSGTQQKSSTSQAGSAQATSQTGQGLGTPQNSSPESSAAERNTRTGQARSAGSPNEGRPSAAMDVRLRMLEAKQKAIREQASQVQAELQQLPLTEVTAQGRARDEAQKRVGQAVEKMKELEERLSDARYEAAPSQDTADLSEPAESARRQLAEAGRAIRQGLSGDKPKTAAEQAREMAEQLAADADALDESLSSADRQRMLERLEAAKRLLQNNPDPQWGEVSGRGTPTGGLVYTQGGPTTPAETARMLAQQFWSIAIEARQKQLQPLVEQPSDVEFFQAEKEFFEKAAQFKQPSTEK